MRRVQEKLSSNWEMDIVDQEPTSAQAALALKQKRLTFAWLDGEAQNVSFHPSIFISFTPVYSSGLICSTIAFDLVISLFASIIRKISHQH